MIMKYSGTLFHQQQSNHNYFSIYLSVITIPTNDRAPVSINETHISHLATTEQYIAYIYDGLSVA